jgi:hypothetical protein
VALSGDGSTVVAGAPDHTVGNNSDQGAAYVFSNSGGSWAQSAELTASDGGANDLLGNSVGVSGDGSTVVAGAPEHTVGNNSAQGAVYVFSDSGGSWAQSAELTASDGGANDQLGYSVGLSGDGSAAVAGAPYRSGSQGAVYVFSDSGGSWAQSAELTASDGVTDDELGNSVALSGDGSTVVAGAPDHTVSNNSDQGAAYVFSNSGGSWAQSAELTASDGAANDQLGSSVGVSGDGSTVVAGAPDHTVGNNSNQGAAYVFSGSGCTAPSDSYATGVLSDSPLAYFPLNDSSGPIICDVSGNGDNGTYATSGVTYGVNGPLRSDPSQTAVAGDGSSPSLLGTAPAITGLSGNQSFTLEGWFRATTTTNETVVALSGGSIAGMAVWSSHTSCAQGSNPNGSALALDEHGTSNCWDTTSDGVNLFDGNWHYLAIVYDSSTDTMTGYVDGTSLGSETAALSSFSWSSPTVLLGGWVDTQVNQPFVGDAAQIAVYGTALSTARIDAHDQAASPPPAAPTVSSVSPSSGPAAGGSYVTITGTGFTRTSTVSFGANAATIESLDSTTITATSPAGTGTVDVTVSNANGTSAADAGDQFTYGPTVSSVSPSSGPASGGSYVTITGTGFTRTSTVSFGANAATIESLDSTTITATSPAGTGTVDVTVSNANGTSAASAGDQFTYTVPDSTHPPSLAIHSGTPVPSEGPVTPTGLAGLAGDHVLVLREHRKLVTTAVSCGAAASKRCHLRGTLSARLRGRRRILSSFTTNIPGGRISSVTVHFNKLSSLHIDSSVKARLEITSTVAGTRPVSSVATVTLVPSSSGRAPQVSTEDALLISPPLLSSGQEGSATLTGIVNGEGQAATYEFEIGPAPGDWTTIVPADGGSVNDASIAQLVTTTIQLPSFDPPDIYYRVVATNDAGTTDGALRSLVVTPTGLSQLPAPLGDVTEAGRDNLTLTDSCVPSGGPALVTGGQISCVITAFNNQPVVLGQVAVRPSEVILDAPAPPGTLVAQTLGPNEAIPMSIAPETSHSVTVSFVIVHPVGPDLAFSVYSDTAQATSPALQLLTPQPSISSNCVNASTGKATGPVPPGGEIRCTLLTTVGGGDDLDFASFELRPSSGLIDGTTTSGGPPVTLGAESPNGIFSSTTVTYQVSQRIRGGQRLSLSVTAIGKAETTGTPVPVLAHSNTLTAGGRK